MTTLDSALAHHEYHDNGGPSSSYLNWLRAAVLGANDGIVSVASIVVGVAGATNSSSAILVAGFAGLSAGALSMAVGEYVSVSTQRDSELAMLDKERKEHAEQPEYELQELYHIYRRKGLTEETARAVAKELTAHDAFAAHVEVELKIDPNELTNPLHAALASAASFFAGAVIPLAAILIAPEHIRIIVTFISVLIALAITGTLSAHAGGAGKVRAAIRVVLGGALAMAITFGVGKIFHISGI